MSFPLFIAKHHLFSRHKIGYISFISLISILGMAVGVAALILTISILNGFEKEVKQKLIGFDAHVRLRLFNNRTLQSSDEIRNQLAEIPEITTIVPYIHTSVMIRHKDEVDGVILEGIREADIRKTLQVERFLKAGRLRFTTADGAHALVIGQKLARTLQIGLDDKVYLFVIEKSRQGPSRPRIGTFVIGGIYESGIADYDDIFVYADLSAAQQLLNMPADQFSGFQILLDDPYRADQVVNRINTEFGYPYHAMSWLDLHLNLFEWLRVQRLPILIVFGLIALVAVFNIVSSLMMIVIEKTRDIGILKSMGVNRRQTVSIFLLEGTVIGVLGTVLGFGLTLGLAWIQLRFGVISIPQDIYFMSRLPLLLTWREFAIIGLLAIFSAMAATLYPSLKAVRLAAAEAVRYE